MMGLLKEPDSGDDWNASWAAKFASAPEKDILAGRCVPLFLEFLVSLIALFLLPVDLRATVSSLDVSCVTGPLTVRWTLGGVYSVLDDELVGVRC